jgi:hypothetical protein
VRKARRIEWLARSEFLDQRPKQEAHEDVIEVRPQKADLDPN